MPARDPKEVDVVLGLDEIDDEEAIRRAVGRRVGRSPDELPPLSILKRSIDARKASVRFHLRVGLTATTPLESLGGPDPVSVEGSTRIVVVGAGPAGLFCAYQLARAGVGCTIVDRGKRVQPRRRDLALLNRGERIDDDSNYCFGEGGAGTYSDGKLYTRSGKRGPVRDVLEILTRNGAPPQILVDARPHIGSNRLPKVIEAIRERLIAVGVRFRFESRVTEILTEGRDARRHVAGVRLSSGEELPAEHIVLATGHSARDVFEMLHALGVRLEPKPFALGVRIEHPQALIDRLQYGKDAGHPKLPPAYYRIARTVGDHGVFSFCMCPGGFIVPAMTEVDGLVVNGMSLSKRGSPFANSGLVVSVDPAEWDQAGHHGPLGGVALQRAIEVAAMRAGGGGHRAPATRAADFLARRGSTTSPPSSYVPGLTAGDVSEVLDVGGLPISSRLREALRAFERKMPGYGGAEAVLVGVETRTSAPIRIPRDPETLQSPGLSGLHPAGEGAGYAGGIVSAALDGIRIAERITADQRLKRATRS